MGGDTLIKLTVVIGGDLFLDGLSKRSIIRHETDTIKRRQRGWKPRQSFNQRSQMITYNWTYKTVELQRIPI